MLKKYQAALIAFIIFFSNHVFSEPGFRALKDIEYANIDGQPLRLDLYLPAGNDSFPLVIYIHGGGFTEGDKSNAEKYAPHFIREGFAFASINYRLAPAAIFPAQIFDVKGAIRFLRAKAKDYHIQSNHIAVFGTSAGASLACLAGVSCGAEKLEGNVGGNDQYSSCVQAVVDGYGSFSFDNMMKNGFAPSREVHVEELFGCRDLHSATCIDKIKMMAPEFYITKDDPPFLILHGKQDTSVPVQNSIDFDRKLKEGGVSSSLIIDPGFGHGDGIVEAHFEEVIKFLKKELM